ncbi:tyrosine-type recombinase/integrase [Luteimonas sp. FXH3W]|uniref:Tyrosine-type recombinase/integrase n=1 Tax=Aquilutibacter rugosus TaxID=3115820 RepID=A0ABU7V0Z0_9GAMM
MGRKRTTNIHLPRNMQRKGNTYYFVKDNVWINLGHDYPGALIAYSGLVGERKGVKTFADVAHEMLETRTADLAPATLALYAYNAKRVLPVFGHMKLEEIKQSHVYRYVHTRDGNAMSNRDRTFMSAVFTYARNAGRFDGTDPTKGLQYRRKESPVERYLGDDELRMVLAAAKPHIAAAIVVLYLIGCRIRDGLDIRVEHVGDDVLTYWNRKAKKWMDVEITPALRQAIDNVLALGRQVGREFLIERLATNSRRAGPYTYAGFRTQWMNALAAAGIESATLHDIRRKAGSDVETDDLAMQLLGHTSTKVTRRHYRAKKTPIKPTK